MISGLHLNRKKKLGMVAHTCHSSEGRKCKIGGLQWAWERIAKPYLQNNQIKKGFMCGSNMKL
jgi:hypothetical protein